MIKKITVGKKTYTVVPNKGKAKPGYIFIRAKGWKVASPFRFPNRLYHDTGTPEHPVLTCKIQPKDYS